MVCLQCWCHRSYPLPTMPSPQPRAKSLQPHGCEPGPPATAAAKHDKTNPHQLQLKRHAEELKRKHALQATALPPSAPTVHARLTEAPTQHKQP